MSDEHFEAIGFYVLATDYWKSAAYINDVREDGRLQLRFANTAPYYLYVHSIELALKAYLRAKGVSKRRAEQRSAFRRSARPCILLSCGIIAAIGFQAGPSSLP
jgi:hypothetical protein